MQPDASTLTGQAPLGPQASLVIIQMQIEDDAAMSTSQQQAQRLQESHTSITAALEQVAMHGETVSLLVSQYSSCSRCNLLI